MDNTLILKNYLVELEAEYTATKKCLERIPVELFGYKPHPKSMELGYLALLVAEIPMWIKLMIEESEIDFATYNHFQPATTQELVDHFEENFKGAKVALENGDNENLEKPFVLKNQETELYSQPKMEGISSTLNHWVHHRGQLTVYMRLNDIAVPSIYGPSADDKVF